ncbi:hypothetical protein P3T76_008657 [Phytophthora citrophthora]|uniref:SWIM-type domain-containing protein n=1 Tax=Phytophthora citrophthora TaxID=4793 RepID=A0AAD9GJD1_9STRA|nr:hypothetical protein P3T76_008657 [Phytophthora citrophthora]
MWRRGKCLCGYFEDTAAPCVHAPLKHTGKLKEMTRFYRGSWKTPVFQAVYAERARTTILPLVLKDALTRGECKAPGIKKKEEVVSRITPSRWFGYAAESLEGRSC